jgi:phytoene dehydrogenase-like protein
MAEGKVAEVAQDAQAAQVGHGAAERVDAVVVGGGHNGLVAAITLAERGRSVVVCEAADRLGGAVATAELTLPGFHHDVFSAVYPAALASTALSRMPLADHGLEWVHPAAPLAHPLEGGRALLLERDIDATATALDRVSPGDGRAWADFARPYVDRFAALRALLFGGFPPVAGLARFTAGAGVGGALELARLLLLPAEALAAELFRSSEVAGWLYGSTLHGDVPPSGAGSAVTGVGLHVMGHAVGWPSPRGGAGLLVDALASYLRSLGGRTRTAAPVERIVSRRGRVAGVRLASGEAIRADVVIADCNPHQLLRLTGDGLDPEERRRLGRFRYGPATMKLDFALSAPIPWAAEEVARAGTVHLGGDADALVRSVGQRAAGALPDEPFLLPGPQSLADPTRAPAGRHTAWAYTRVPHGVDWSANREPFAERMQAQVERFAPGFGDVVLDRHVMAPADLEARNSTLVGGDVGGGTYALDQLVFRPTPSLLPYRTSLRGLYLGSSSAFPGGAVHGIPGRAAARLALLEAPLRRLW